MGLPRIGILGGGQLAQMLCEAAKSAWNESPAVFSDALDCPAATATSNITVGEMNVEDLSKFLSQIDVVLFESEFVDVGLLREVEGKLKSSSSQTCTFLPSLETMSCLQDKLLQKELCVSCGCPTAQWKVFESNNDIKEQIQKFKKLFPEGAVLKWSRNGYDGKGNFFVTGWDEQSADIEKFIHEGLKKSAVTYAERMVKFKEELAVVCVRTMSGALSSYPVVVSQQKKGTCLNVFGPAQQFQISKDIEKSVIGIAERIGNASNIVGAYAVELFLDEDNQLSVNEIAPRVHNTGHYTQDSTETSQFENHIRVALNLPVGSCEPNCSFFGMRNILGPASIEKAECPAPIASASSKLHWYYKKGTRPGRKLGHINIVADSQASFDRQWRQALSDEDQWIESLSKG